MFTVDEILNFRDNIVTEVKKLIGVPFRHGGITHSGLDCKGCPWLAYVRAGISYLPSSDGNYYPPDWYLFVDNNRYLDGLLNYFNYTNTPQKADLVLFSTSKRLDVINHAGVLCNTSKFIHAKSGSKVTSDDLNDPHWKKRFKGYLILKEFDLRSF